jgi:glycosyltransferase involved in cell wall biosynthesis
MSFSVVIAAHDRADALKRNLPKLLEQQYEPGYEVIVVDESSTDETSEVLTEMKAAYPNFYSTYIPASSHYVSRRKLALTLGIKAAHNERIIITDADCSPVSNHWLETIANHCPEENDVLCCFTYYDESTPEYYSYLRLKSWCMQTARPYRCAGACVIIRKSLFMQKEGFIRNLTFRRGEFDFLVNESETAARMVDNDCYLLQECPTKKEWLYEQLHYLCIQPHLHHKWCGKLMLLADQTLLHAVTLGTIAYAAFASIQGEVLYATIALLVLLLFIILRFAIDYLRTKKLGVSIAWWKLPFFDYRYLWTMLCLRFRYVLADKADFIRK